MGRIRTIKPELPHSESLSKCSREARYCFVLLFTIADDAGRIRASSRLLASLLYPYDDDVPALIDGWLDQLESRECIRRYEIDGAHYLDLPKWLEHQKIDHPTKSRLPEFAKPRENSRSLAPDLGPRTVDQDQGSDPKGSASLDLKTTVFKQGLGWLSGATGRREESLRSLLGKWCKNHGDGNVIDALAAAQREAPAESIAWIEARLAGKRGNGRPAQSAVTPFGVGG